MCTKLYGRASNGHLSAERANGQETGETGEIFLLLFRRYNKSILTGLAGLISPVPADK